MSDPAAEQLDSKEMPNTAVALIDALGFKGIWDKYPPRRVVRTLELVREGAEHFLNWGNNLIHKGIVVSTGHFSDTVIVTANRGPGVTESEVPDQDLVSVLGRTVLNLTTTALTTHPPLIYRGCVSFGQMLSSTTKSFFVGPAIDEAARSYEAADAALVWLCPSALKALGDLGQGRRDLWFVEWPVPLRGGHSEKTRVLNTMADIWEPGGSNNAEMWARASVIREGALEHFGNSEDVRVAVKRQNTERFLDAAERHSRKYYARNGFEE